jgi:hypothetical protein
MKQANPLIEFDTIGDLFRGRSSKLGIDRIVRSALFICPQVVQL